ncbi:Hypothetical protein, putative [Bodo saltans]|uniref:Uncharacterized protein n=1 Tax=Bodo saltans TaxID=75058 RepID=A0A0S4IX37_BODSA|nr:Hypothetical protein, putative [Bodo saltans]|eukprot:CUF87208.1 Hypothetical protein, putative [Bodo saltans]
MGVALTILFCKKKKHMKSVESCFRIENALCEIMVAFSAKTIRYLTREHVNTGTACLLPSIPHIHTYT